jgi:murein DD-endopeptidase MepM/ murein hydrolase activator NlpD
MIMSFAITGLAGCSPADPRTPGTPTSPTSALSTPTPPTSATKGPSTSNSAPGSPTTPESPKPTSRSPKPEQADPRWRFFTKDRTRYRSAWFDGAHRIMIPFGCTAAPYYSPDSRCEDDQGFHHGIDVALPCGTPIRAGLAGTVVDPSRPGSPGPAYGSKAFRLRVATDDGPVDVLIAHARTVRVQPGERVRRGEVIAETGDLGAPDGCHLHFEQRAADGGLSTATDPARLLAFSAR